MDKIRPAAINAESDKNRIPAANEFVFLTRSPTTKGPRKPPRLPTELISPMHVAAAVPVRKLVGNDQKPGR